MKLDLTDEQIGILNELCFEKLLTTAKYHDNKFIDKAQVLSYERKIRELLNILIVDK